MQMRCNPAPSGKQQGGRWVRGTRTRLTDHKPLISIITSTYNAEDHLQEAAQSIRDQHYRNFEWIVIDGASVDGTLDILRSNEDVIDCWLSEPDQGIYDAWNKGLQLAQGDWICFLGADDYFLDAQVLTKLSSRLVACSLDVRVVYARVMLLDKNGERLYAVGEAWEKARFKKYMCIPHQGVMHRRSLFERHGPFDASFRIAGDYEMLLRELKTSEAAFIPDLITVGMRQGGGASSKPQSSLVLLLETRRAQRMHGQRFPSWLWVAAVMRTYVRLLLWHALGEQWARKALDLGRRMLRLPVFWTKT